MGQLFHTSQLLLAEGAEGAGAHGPLYPATHLGFSLILTLVVMFGLMAAAKQGLNVRVFKKFITNCFEQLYLFIENMCVGTIGPHGAEFIPYIMTFWMVIFTCNVLALFMPFAPTANLSFNLGMALISIVYVQYRGMRANGVGGHISHFSGPKLSGMLKGITVMIFCIEILSELMKNVSLTLRLYGNIHGGHAAVEAMNNLGKVVYLPIGEFLLPIKILTCLVQAMIFTLLTCVYISLATHHEEGGDHHADGIDGAVPAPAH